MVRKWGTGVQPTCKWGILRLQPTDPNLLAALPRGHHYANQPQEVQKVGAWPSQVDLERLLCSEVKPPGKPSRVSGGNTCVFFRRKSWKRSHLIYLLNSGWMAEYFTSIWIIVIMGGWRIFQCSTTMLRHQCFEGFLESNGFPQDDDPHQRSLVVWDPPQKKNIPTFLFSGKKANDDGRRNPGASCGSFWCDRNLLLRRCFFSQKEMWSFVGSYSWRGIPHFLR